jgi:hypothetical protein
MIFKNNIEIEIVVSNYEDLKTWLNGLALVIKHNKKNLSI